MILKVTSIRTKLQLTFCVFLFFSITIAGISFYYLGQITRYQQIKSDLDQLTILVLEARKYEKDFLLTEPSNMAFMKTGLSINLINHAQTIKHLDSLLAKIKDNSIIKHLDIQTDLNSIETNKKKYADKFVLLGEKIRERGFKDDGLEGEMRNVIHTLENNHASIIDKSSVLMLRRHEKDFLLRKDEKYIGKLHEVANALRDNGNALVKNDITLYITLFDKIVDLEREIGLAENKGLKGELKASFEEIEPAVNHIRSLVSSYTQGMIDTSTWIIGTLVLFVLLLTTVLAYYFSYSISSPIILLDRISKSIIKKLKNQEKLLDRLQTDDELGSLAKNFQCMLIKLKENLKAVEEQNKILKASSEEEKKDRWVIEGLTMMEDILRKQYPSLDELCYAVISKVAKYMEVNQAAMFVVQEENDREVFLELKSTYAYDRKKYIQKRIAPGQGMVGEAYLEGQYIYMTEVPQNYIKITSGLGDSTPTCILIMPLKSNGQVLGVIELASFHPLEKHNILFLEKLSENIASTLSALKINNQTKLLLVQSQEMSEELKAKEEEMRLNLEKLLATEAYEKRLQLELKEKEELLLLEIATLRQDNTILKLKQSELLNQVEQKTYQQVDLYVHEIEQLQVQISNKESQINALKQTNTQLEEELIDYKILSEFSDKIRKRSWEEDEIKEKRYNKL